MSPKRGYKCRAIQSVSVSKMKRKQQTKGKNMKNKNSHIGKKVIVRAQVAGVHCGIVTEVDFATQTVKLKDAYRMWRFYTRDTSGSISDVAAHGIKPDGGHSIGAKLKSTTINNPQGLEISEMTDEAYKSVQEWRN